MYRKLLGLAVAAVMSFTTAASAQDVLRVGRFVPQPPAIAAQAKGYFAEENLSVQYLQVASSTQQFQFLRDGGYDLIQTAPDNVVNYRFNTTKNAQGAKLDVTMLDGLDYGANLRLMSQKAFTTPESLRGKRLGVDATDSGFAFVLYKILAGYGLSRSDYQVVAVGGVSARYNAMAAGTIDATLLSHNFVIQGQDIGLNSLDTVYTIADPYLAYNHAALVPWLQANEDKIVRYLRAYYKGHLFATDPANREEVIRLMTDARTPRSVAERLYDVYMTENVGLTEDMRLDRKGLAAVLELRAENDGFDEPQNLKWMNTPASGLYDLSYLRKAIYGSHWTR